MPTCVLDREEMETSSGRYMTDAQFLERVRSYAKDSIQKFFKGKEFHSGGPIPKYKLLDKEKVEMVMSTEFDPGLELVQESLLADPFFDQQKIHQMDSDTRLVIELSSEMAQLKIPKYFTPGLILLYIELCLGVKVEYERLDEEFDDDLLEFEDIDEDDEDLAVEPCSENFDDDSIIDHGECIAAS